MSFKTHLLALINLLIVHDLMLLESDEGWEDFVTDIADLRGSWSVFALVVLQAVLTLELFVTLRVEESGHNKKWLGKLSASHLIAMEDWFSVRDLMLFEAMALVESLKAVLALEFWLVRYILKRRLTRLRLSFLRLRLAVLVDLLVLALFVRFQVLPAGECVVAEAAVEEGLRWRRQILGLDLHTESQHLRLICGHKIHSFDQENKVLQKKVRDNFFLDAKFLF